MKKQNNALASFWYCIYSVILTIAIVACYTTAFKIKASLVTCTAATIIFVTVIGLICALVKHKSKFFTSLSVILIVFIFTVLFSLSFIFEEFRYFLNCILKIYSAYLAVPKPVELYELSQTQATSFLVVVSFILSFIFTSSLVRARRFLPVLIITITSLIPCFILVTTLPALPAIISIVAILFSLYITTFLRRKNARADSVASPIISVIMIITATVICLTNPVDTFKRIEWQEELLDKFEEITGMDGGDSSSNGDENAKSYNKIGNSFEKTKWLSKVGPLKPSNKKAMQIYTEKGGTVYLRGISYGDYSFNQWNLLHENSIKTFPANINSFTLAKAESSETTTLNVITEKIEPVIYSTYYMDEVPEKYTVLGDVCISNDDNELYYNYDYQVSDGSDLIMWSTYDDYISYVYDNYLYLPDATREEIQIFAMEKGFSIDDSTEAIADIVKAYVSNIGYYSLDTEPMPDGKDFPLWFLTEAESGYCVHYATTAAVMLRAFGVPARYVTGYIANAKANEWTTVTEKNAHAWVEYFDSERGWIMLEATPSSFEIPDNEKEESSTATQASTQSTTKPSSKPSDTQNNKNHIDFKFSPFMLIFIIPVMIVLTIGAILLRCKIIRKKRNEQFTQSRNNSKAIYIYRYIRLISLHSTNIIPDVIEEIALKAKYSNHSIDNNEIEILKQYADEAKNELYMNSGKIKRIYLKFIKVI